MTRSEEQVRTAVAQQAGTWFIANQSGPLDHADRSAFVAWLKASPIHVEEYLGVALVAHDLRAAIEDPQVPLESLIEQARVDDSDDVISLETPLRERESASRQILTPRRWSYAASFASVMLVLAASLLWWLHDGELLGLPKTYQTAHGEQRVARLPDGSQLHLNTDSTVTVRYTKQERVVEISHGEALFTVAHDVNRRFRVEAGEAHVLAVGTQFDVYRKLETTVVTVVEGTVAVVAPKQQPSRYSFAAPPHRREDGLPSGAQRIDAGFQTRVDAGVLADQPTPVDTRQVLSWLQHKIAFERRPLGEVADEFNRYGSIPIEIEDAPLRALPISGVFDAYDTDSFVAFLETLDGVSVERTSTRIRVISSKATTP